MSWFWKLVLRGRLRRLKGVQQAAALMATGRLDEAAEWLERWKPRAYLEDVSVYHFVAGRIQMERGDLRTAESHLMAAKALGLGTPSLSLMLAILKARQGQLGEAQAILTEAGKPRDEDLRKQFDALGKAIGQVASGQAVKALRKQAERFARDELKATLSQGEKVRHLADSLQQRLTRPGHAGTVDPRIREGASALFGEVLVQCCRGAWHLGLEASDHRIVVRGVALSPLHLVEDLLAGRVERLSQVVDDPVRFSATYRGIHPGSC